MLSSGSKLAARTKELSELQVLYKILENVLPPLLYQIILSLYMYMFMMSMCIVCSSYPYYHKIVIISMGHTFCTVNVQK